MLAGPLVTIAYMVLNSPAYRHFWGLAPEAGLWWGVQPISAGVFGVPAGFAAIGLGVLWSAWRPMRTDRPHSDKRTLSGPGL
jgi:Na+(H+)/acetate symporter ActP